MDRANWDHAFAVGDDACSAEGGPVAKKKSLVASEQRRRAVREYRRWFEREVAAVPKDKLIFIDEAGCNTSMTRRYGRSPRGKRVRFYRPANRGPNISFIGAIKEDDLVGMAAYEGAINVRRFLEFVIAVLLPALRIGDVVVMDNLRVHKHPAIRALIESRGARLLFLPPYTPELNPIEEFWSKFKSLLRDMAARTVPALVNAAGHVLKFFRQSDFQGWFRHCGYA